LTSVPSVRQWRSFGLLVGGVFAVLGSWRWALRGESPRPVLLALAVFLILPALVYPPLLAQPYRAWMALGHALGWINTRIILTIVFYGIFMPIGLVMRAFGRDPMRRRFDPGAASYRQEREARPGSHMHHQF
jgi:hypothetical protein